MVVFTSWYERSRAKTWTLCYSRLLIFLLDVAVRLSFLGFLSPNDGATDSQGSICEVVGFTVWEGRQDKREALGILPFRSRL